MEGVRSRRSTFTVYGNSMACPVCGRSFPLSRVSGHVNRCIAKTNGGADDTPTHTRSSGKRPLQRGGNDSDHPETDRPRRKQRGRRARLPSDTDATWTEIAVGRIPFQSKALPSRTQARLQKYDDMLLTNERMARAEARRQRKRQRRSTQSASAEASSSVTEDSELQSIDTPSEGPDEGKHAHAHAAREAKRTALHALVDQKLAHAAAAASTKQLTATAPKLVLEKPLEIKIASIAKAFKLREITEDQFLERLTAILKGQPRATVDKALRDFNEAMGPDASGDQVAGAQAPPQEHSTLLAERRRLLREHASFTAARTQGTTAVPDNVPLPMKAADHGSEPYDMDNARDFVDRIKQRFAGRPYKLKEFYALVLQHSRQLGQSGLSSSDVLAILVSFCKVFSGEEDLIDELVSFLPHVKPELSEPQPHRLPPQPSQSQPATTDTAPHAPPLSIDQLRFPNMTPDKAQSELARALKFARRIARPTALSASGSTHSASDSHPTQQGLGLLTSSALPRTQQAPRDRPTTVAHTVLQQATSSTVATPGTTAGPAAVVGAQPAGYYSAWPYGTVYAASPYPSAATATAESVYDWTSYSRRPALTSLPVQTVQYVYAAPTRLAGGAATVAYPTAYAAAGASPYATYAYATPGTAYPTVPGYYPTTTASSYPYRVISGYELQTYDGARAPAGAYLGQHPGT